MTKNPPSAPACLEDDEGGTLRVYPWASGRVSLVARDLLAMLPDLCYEPEGDVIPGGVGYVAIHDDGEIMVRPGGYYMPASAEGPTVRRLLLDPPAPVTPEWHSARIVEAVCRGRACQWARTQTDGLWVSLDGESREAYTPDLSDVTVVVPGEVGA